VVCEELLYLVDKRREYFASYCSESSVTVRSLSGERAEYLLQDITNGLGFCWNIEP
jgi:hypothetical protein